MLADSRLNVHFYRKSIIHAVTCFLALNELSCI